MAEQFLNRLSQIESSIASLGKTLERMITILTAVTEIKSEIKLAKGEILEAIGKQPRGTSAGGSTDEGVRVLKAEIQRIEASLTEAIETLRQEISQSIQGIQIAAPASVSESVVAAPSVGPAARVPADKAMQVAEILQGIIGSLKMGCLAGDVIEALADAKSSVMKMLPSDPIMVKIDRWSGMVATYPKRNELQAKDILKLKQEIKAEIARYQPA
ncbi:MAG: hypothetical protein C4K49_05365 [Candidatus Thorarchaeota archaeon]|nr:MAG: hypothetical protein C4K49_05365 [Candidatus Thorarchaeota archaeon]